MIGILGGAFDPIHFGHIRPARQLLDELPLREIRLIPCHTPPHKARLVASPEHRWNMLNIVTGHTPGLQADDRELRRGGVSYSIDTLAELRTELGNQVPLCWIMGVDAYAGLTGWYRWEALLERCHLVVTHRPGSELPAEGAAADLLRTAGTADPAMLAQHPAGRILIHPVKPIDAASSQLRQTIAEGRQPRYQLPGPIWAYIRRYGLYGAGCQ